VAAVVTAVLGPGHRGDRLVHAERTFHPVAAVGTAGGAQRTAGRSLTS
jgi:hypothetical protein